MAQQTIGLGAAPNDGTGDSLRTAGDKMNDNFTELYAFIKRDSVSISSAQILNSFTSPVQLIAAPGANKAIKVFSAVLVWTYGTAAYITNTNARVSYQSSLANITESTGISVSQDSIAIPRLANLGAANRSAISNNSVVFHTLVGNPTTGDSTLEIIIDYAIIDV